MSKATEGKRDLYRRQKKAKETCIEGKRSAYDGNMIIAHADTHTQTRMRTSANTLVGETIDISYIHHLYTYNVQYMYVHTH